MSSSLKSASLLIMVTHIANSDSKLTASLSSYWCQNTDEFTTTLADVRCLHQTVKAFLPEMISGNHGHIVTVSSAAGLFGTSGLGDYGASKAAAVGFHEAVRMELYALNKTGVHMTLVCPFFINTGMFKGVKTRYLHQLLATVTLIFSCCFICDETDICATYFHFSVNFSGKPGLTSLPFVFSLYLYWYRNFGDKWCMFFWIVCQPAVSILNKTQSSDSREREIV